MKKREICPACATRAKGTESIALIAPWVRELANVAERSTRYFICFQCGTGWVDVNYSATSMNLLYSDYRGKKYLETRRKWETTYSESFNASIDDGDKHMDLRRRQMESLILANSPSFHTAAKSVLDIGGGHGSLIPTWHQIQEKYVLDVSGVETLDGVKSISTWSEIPDGCVLSLVMACGILEHLTSPKDFLDSVVFEIQKYNLTDSESLFYFEVPAGVPNRKKMRLKYSLAWSASFFPTFWVLFDQLQAKFGRASFPMRIAEHIQFFTPDGLKSLITSSGLEYLGSNVYSAKESLENPESIRFGDILGVLARFPKNLN
jgi:hypothetical protein